MTAPILLTRRTHFKIYFSKSNTCDLFHMTIIRNITCDINSQQFSRTNRLSGWLSHLNNVISRRRLLFFSFSLCGVVADNNWLSDVTCVMQHAKASWMARIIQQTMCMKYKLIATFWLHWHVIFSASVPTENKSMNFNSANQFAVLRRELSSCILKSRLFQFFILSSNFISSNWKPLNADTFGKRFLISQKFRWSCGLEILFYWLHSQGQSWRNNYYEKLQT